MQRRAFLASAAAAATTTAAPAPARFRKGICSIIFPAGMSFAEKFKQARSAGFEGIELRLGGNDIQMDAPADDVKRVGEEARKAGIEIVSLWCSDPLGKNPLNHDDPAVRARGVEGIRRAVDFCSWLNCGAMLLVPGRVGSGPKLNVGYEATWERITAELKKVVPYAAKAKVCLTPENVWNKFLLSPLEMRTFVDQFKSPWLQVHFDIGNVMQFGYPEDWILTLGPRVKRVHAKDYKLSSRAEQGGFVELLEGDVNWKATMAALVKVGYRGFVSPEISGDPKDPEKIRKVSAALDKILSLA